MITIFYAFYQNKNWSLLLASTNYGLCYIGFNEKSIESLVKTCNKQFSHCDYVEDIEKLKPYIKELNQYFDGKLTSFTIPLHFHGTNFQMSVWNALLTIPYGEKVSYSHIASVIQKPKAVRAVGTAIGKNPIPIIIPCHRVIEKDGSLGGYSGGLEIKKQLLAIENE